MQKIEIAVNTLGFEPDLTGCKSVDEISKRLKENFPSDKWSFYEGGYHVRMWSSWNKKFSIFDLHQRIAFWFRSGGAIEIHLVEE